MLQYFYVWVLNSYIEIMTTNLYGSVEAHTYYLVVGCVLHVTPKSGLRSNLDVVPDLNRTLLAFLCQFRHRNHDFWTKHLNFNDNQCDKFMHLLASFWRNRLCVKFDTQVLCQIWPTSSVSKLTHKFCVKFDTQSSIISHSNSRNHDKSDSSSKNVCTRFYHQTLYARFPLPNTIPEKQRNYSYGE